MVVYIPAWLQWFVVMGFAANIALLGMLVYGVRPKIWRRKSVYKRRGLLVIKSGP